ncbi:MAG TPA: hypothetical protein DCE18_18990, partial [Syntrophobacteraceae bacterium]|nr:hypothetical protein [Syntrophobacteraceae bacterium]
MALSHEMPPAESANAKSQQEQDLLGAKWFGGIMTALANFPEPALAADLDGRLVHWNVAGERLLGLGHESGAVLAAEAIRLMGADKGGSWAVMCAQEGSIHQVPVTVRTHLGAERAMTITANLVKDSADVPLGCVAILRDAPQDLFSPPQIHERLAMLTSILEN